MKKFLCIAVALGLFALIVFMRTGTALAHPGRTDASGCHTCKTNCSSWGLSYGEYHCHRAKALPQPEPPIKSIRGENGTGRTVPAPEYKQPAPSLATPSPVAATSNGTPQKRSFWQWLSGLFGK